MLVNQLISRGAAGKVALIEKEAVYSYAQLQARQKVFGLFICPGIRERDNVALCQKLIL